MCLDYRADVPTSYSLLFVLGSDDVSTTLWKQKSWYLALTILVRQQAHKLLVIE